MTFFDLEWLRCPKPRVDLHGYQIEDRRGIVPTGEDGHRATGRWTSATVLIGPDRYGTVIDESFGGGRYIVPTSRKREAYRPLKVPAAYREFAKWDGSDEGLLKLFDAYGFLFRANAKSEKVETVKDFIARLKHVVAAIDRRDWQTIADWLNRARKDHPSHGGIGSLGVLFELSEGQPTLKLRPASLADALHVQALSDASLGIKHRKCKNQECDRWFPTEGPGAYRSDAEYHSPACQRRHAYLKRLKKERR